MTANPIWAVARNTIAQAIRVRVAFVIMGIYLVLVPVLPFVLEGDGTLRGLLRVVITYAFIAAGFLLGVLTLALSTTTLWSELREKQIFVLESKPVRRWHILLGKLLGIMAINAALIAFMGVVTWACVRVIAGQERWKDNEYGHARQLADEQVLTARRVANPEPPDLTNWVDRRLEELKKNSPDRLRGKTQAAIEEELRKEGLDIVNAVTPRRGRVWRVRGLPTSLDPKTDMTIRFKFAAPSESTEEPILILWMIGKYKDPRAIRFWASYAPEQVHEVQVPASAIADDGVLEIHLWNVDKSLRTMVFTGDDAMQVLLPVGGFAGNLARGLALVLVEVLFLAVLGLFCSTFLTFPVSPIVALSLLLLIYLTSAMHARIQQDIEFEYAKPQAEVALSQRLVRVVTAVVRFVLPPFDRYSPTSAVSSGEEVSWWRLLTAIGEIVLLRGGVFVFFAVLIFERRELAAAVR